LGGIVLAFKDFKYNLGIFGSPWNGLKNIEFFFKSNAALQVTINTLGYNLVFIIFGLLINIVVALLMNEIRSRNAIKVYQTAMFFPFFMSWVVVAFIVYAFLSPGYGILNQIIVSFGGKPGDWYTNPSIWPVVLFLSNTWKNMGYGVLLNYAVLVGIDISYYEAARADGASRLKMARHISIPFLVPITLIQVILATGRIFNSDFGLFYQVPQNSSLLYHATDVIDTYVFRALMYMNDIGMSTAIGLFQSFLGLILVIVVNKIVKSTSEDIALF
jgi:putative aldouronate transport system permease protein